MGRAYFLFFFSFSFSFSFFSELIFLAISSTSLGLSSASMVSTMLAMAVDSPGASLGVDFNLAGLRFCFLGFGVPPVALHEPRWFRLAPPQGRRRLRADE